MRFPKYKNQSAQGRGESTAEPRQQQQSYLQRVRSQLASLRVPYQSKKHSNKDSKKNKKQNAHDEESATTAVASCKQDELRPTDQDIVYHLGSSDSAYYTVSQHLRHEEPRHNAAVDQDANSSSSKNQPSRLYLLSWGEAKTRIQQTTMMIRDVCVTTSSALLSSAWRVYPRNNKDVCSPPFSPASSSSSGADTPPPKRRMKEKEQYEQWLTTTAGRESEISICMSYYSSRSLSDAATDNEDHQQQVKIMRSSSRGSFSSGSTPRARENDPFRRRGSSTDSYKTIYHERLSSGRNEDSRRSYDEEEREDFDDEIIRDSLFMLHGKPYTVKNEWI